jgi:hypothetical protein
LAIAGYVEATPQTVLNARLARSSADCHERFGVRPDSPPFEAEPSGCPDVFVNRQSSI